MMRTDFRQYLQCSTNAEEAIGVIIVLFLDMLFAECT